MSVITENTKKMFNPFPGLRPFSMQESHLFFGREQQTEDILHKITSNRFVAVLGASGSGKSSLMYCGVIPTLYGGFLSQKSSKWKVVTTYPGNKPIENLAKAIADLNKKTLKPEDVYYNEAITFSILRSSSRGLIEAVKQLRRPKGENLLIMVDQFEELFRFKQRRHEADTVNESFAFVKLLTEAVKQNETPIYVALTMRSDFIGDCSEFQELTAMINQSYYLVPQMSREDMAKAVMGPVSVGGGDISEGLVSRLLNDIGDNPDQLPILQHAMMRTWEYWIKNRVGDEPMSESHYDAVGRMEKALSEHANEAYDELSSRGKEICENIFKSITEKGTDNRGVRRPTRVSELAAIANAEVSEVIKVVDVFRQKGRSFLSPPAGIQINEDSIIDISHESLMRIWERLIMWVDEESAAVQMYLRLADAAEKYQIGEGPLWKPPDLQLALAWKKKKKPTLVWAKRYHPAFERTMVFLNTGEKEYEAEEKNKIKRQKRTLKRQRTFSLVLGGAAIIAIGLTLYSRVLQVEALTQKELAAEKAQEALKQQMMAEIEKEKALAENYYAKSKSKEAEIQAEIAGLEKEKAEVQRVKAFEYARLAEDKTLLAELQKAKADSNAIMAQLQKLKADTNALNAMIAGRQAYKLRLQSIARSMAVKSIQIKDDSHNHEKALVALQAYNFNKEYEGIMHNSDIYNALYFGLKALKGKSYNLLNAHDASVRTVIYDDKDKVLYSTSSSGDILRWKNGNTRFVPELIKKNEFVNKQIAINKSRQYLACAGGNKKIQVFDIQNKDNLIGSYESHTQTILSIAFSENKIIYSTAADSTLRKLNVETGDSEIIIKENTNIISLDISPNGKLIAGGTANGKIYLWHKSKNYASIVLSEDDGNPVYSVAFSPDGTLLATGDKKGRISLWNVISGKVKKVLVGHQARINALKFSNDNMYLAAAGFDGIITLWNLSSLNLRPIVLSDGDSWVWSIDFDKNNKFLYAGRHDGYIQVWPIDIDDMASEFCPLLQSNMSYSQWLGYVAADIPYEKTCENKALGKNVAGSSIVKQAINNDIVLEGARYKILIKKSKNKLNTSAENFNGMIGVEEYHKNGDYWYLVGNLKSLNEAKELKQLVKAYGFKQLQIVKKQDGEITIIS